MYRWSSLIAEYGSTTGQGCLSCSWSAEQGNKINIPLSPFAPEIWSRETDSAVPSRVSLLILNTQAESDWLVLTQGIPPAFRDGFHLFGHTPSGQSRVYRVTQLCTDGVHCRESASTGAVVLKVVPATGAAFASPWTNLCAPLFSYTDCTNIAINLVC